MMLGLELRRTLAEDEPSGFVLERRQIPVPQVARRNPIDAKGRDKYEETTGAWTIPANPVDTKTVVQSTIPARTPTIPMNILRFLIRFERLKIASTPFCPAFLYDMFYASILVIC